MFLGGLARFECAEILPFAGLRIFLPRIEPKLTRFEFPDHRLLQAAARIVGERLKGSYEGSISDEGLDSAYDLKSEL